MRSGSPESLVDPVPQSQAEQRSWRGDSASPVAAAPTAAADSPSDNASQTLEEVRGEGAVARDEPVPERPTAARAASDDTFDVIAASDVGVDVDGDFDGDFEEGVIEHVQLLARLIDREELEREETIQLLGRIVRQHSIARESAHDYLVRRLGEKPLKESSG